MLRDVSFFGSQSGSCAPPLSGCRLRIVFCARTQVGNLCQVVALFLCSRVLFKNAFLLCDDCNFSQENNTQMLSNKTLQLMSVACDNSLLGDVWTLRIFSTGPLEWSLTR